MTGIDISPEGIKKARIHAKTLNLPASFYVMNAEQTEFENDSFDIIVGTGILHHLDLHKAHAELQRLLRPDGHMVFIEPMGHNPFINLYRARTPQMRTEDEHPLLMSDIQLLREFFEQVEPEFFSLFTLGAVPFYGTPLFDATYSFTRFIDRVLLSIPGIQQQAWTVVIHTSHPKKAELPLSPRQ